MLEQHAIRIVIYSIAVWRFTLLLVEEDGPWRIFSRIRAWVGIETKIETELDEQGQYHTEAIKILSENAGFLAEMLMCPYCTSGWLSLVATAGFLQLPWYELIVVWGCIWGIAAVIFKFLRY